MSIDILDQPPPETKGQARGLAAGGLRDKSKVLIVALNYAPELVGCAKYTTELATELVERGHSVQAVTGPPYYPDWTIADGYSGARWSREVRDGVTVHRTPLYVPRHPSGMKRVAHLGSFGLAAMPTAISVARRFSPDIVFAVAPTLAAANAALLAARITGAASWLHMQDFEVDAAFELGLLKSPNARRFALGAERRVLRSFDRVSSISPAMVERLKQKGVADEQATQLRNWVHIEGTKVFASSNTEYRRELGIRPDDIVALYSGNMAAKQNIESLAEVAARLKAARAPVVVLLCGAGPTRAHLEAACSGLENVRFLPLQPLERLAELLGTADIHLLPQRREAADLVLPSKLTGMLASARPVVAMAEPGTGLAQEVEGCGFVVAAEAEAMSEAVMQLSRNPGLRQELGAAARRRAEQRWSRTAIINSFEREMASLRH